MYKFFDYLDDGKFIVFLMDIIFRFLVVFLGENKFDIIFIISK